MREILFRGRRKENGVWLCGDLRQWSETRKGILDYSLKHTIEVDPETVGQFTGLTDKNGTKIFEGDIVDILTENEEIGVVAYDDGGFWVNADGFCVDFHSNINGFDLEVIGNIHDQPELLKERD